jgi:hypothetical protein
MGWMDFLFGSKSDLETVTTKPKGRLRKTVSERRASRQQQLADLQERMALEEARAKVRQYRARGRAKIVTGQAPSQLATVRETLEEALDLADSLRGNRREDSVGANADAPGWERLLNSPAGIRLAEAVAPALAPLLAGILSPTASSPVPSADKRPQNQGRLAAVPNEDEENVAINLIASVVAYADRNPQQAASALVENARSHAVAGNPELLQLVTQAAKTPPALIRMVAGKYRQDETHGRLVARVLDTPKYLETLLDCLQSLLRPPDKTSTVSTF